MFSGFLPVMLKNLVDDEVSTHAESGPGTNCELSDILSVSKYMFQIRVKVKHQTLQIFSHIC